MAAKLQTEDQVQGICLECRKNKQKPAPKSKGGFKRYLKLCSKCTRLSYGTEKTGKEYTRHKKERCERCWFKGDPCQLDVHHKDHNHKNDDPSNLETLCANCHRLEHKPKTYPKQKPRL